MNTPPQFRFSMSHLLTPFDPPWFFGSFYPKIPYPTWISAGISNQSYWRLWSTVRVQSPARAKILFISFECCSALLPSWRDLNGRNRFFNKIWRIRIRCFAKGVEKGSCTSLIRGCPLSYVSKMFGFLDLLPFLLDREVCDWGWSTVINPF